MDEDWIQYKQNPHIQKNSRTNEFKCRTCSKYLGTNAGAAGYHSKSSHSLTLSGEEIKNQELENAEKKNKNVEKGNETKSKRIEEIENELRTRNEQNEENLETEYLVYEDVQKDVVKGATEIAKDPELLFEFQKLKLEDRIPYDWDFYLWIKACVKTYNEIFKIHVGLWQDIKNLPTDILEWQKLVFEETAHLRKTEELE